MEYYIGWDVGGWGCANNSVSKDALIMLDSNGALVDAWRGSLSKILINNASPPENLKSILSFLNQERKGEKLKLYFAIDAVLGLPLAFTPLWQQNSSLDSLEIAGVSNPYLFRETERIVTTHMNSEDKGISQKLRRNQPLSLLRDSLGSQATKALHFIHSLGLKKSECGLFWQGFIDGLEVIVLETYPSTVRTNNAEEFETVNDDIVDALKCAKVAQLFASNKIKNFYSANIPPELAKIEGWIWQPKEIINLGVKPNELHAGFFKPKKQPRND
jgi:hypothetical protein